MERARVEEQGLDTCRFGLKTKLARCVQSAGIISPWHLLAERFSQVGRLERNIYHVLFPSLEQFLKDILFAKTLLTQ
jgi:hypothetical protein